MNWQMAQLTRQEWDPIRRNFGRFLINKMNGEKAEQVSKSVLDWINLDNE
ncbi:hypothetical protein [Limosilactobacillus walteri]|nr:hypothetical protein [Limosilactobacillus walteri]